MKTKKCNARIIYIIIFVLILMSEIYIALFVKDSIIRPYVGDILVTVLLCCFVRMFFSSGIRFLPLYVFVFSVIVEVSQYFDLVKILGLADNRFFSIVLGTYFSFIDILCYAAGCIIFFIIEKIMKGKTF
ncbi:MAG: DUF2809 domain-containing protein [Clostridia bacterium]|nr:DUF2809 domain-containing protein [Clostridia bacterium]